MGKKEQSTLKITTTFLSSTLLYIYFNFVFAQPNFLTQKKSKNIYLLVKRVKVNHIY